MAPESESSDVRVARLEEQIVAVRESIKEAKGSLDVRMKELNDVRTRFVDRIAYEREHNSLRENIYREFGILKDRVIELEKGKGDVKYIGDLDDRIVKLEQSKASAVGTIAAYGSIVAFLLAALAIARTFFR